jgi:hypothetical protein
MHRELALCISEYQLIRKVYIMTKVISPAKSVAEKISITEDDITILAEAVQLQDVANGKWSTAASQWFNRGMRWEMLQDGDKGDKAAIAIVDKVIVSTFTERGQQLMATKSLAELTPDDKISRKVWGQKLAAHRGTFRKHLKTCEMKAAGGAGETRSFADIRADVLREMIKDIQKAPNDKITFDVSTVINLLRETIAELT